MKDFIECVCGAIAGVLLALALFYAVPADAGDMNDKERLYLQQEGWGTMPEVMPYAMNYANKELCAHQKTLPDLTNRNWWDYLEYCIGAADYKQAQRIKPVPQAIKPAAECSEECS